VLDEQIATLREGAHLRMVEKVAQEALEVVLAHRHQAVPHAPLDPGQGLGVEQLALRLERPRVVDEPEPVVLTDQDVAGVAVGVEDQVVEQVLLPPLADPRLDVGRLGVQLVRVAGVLDPDLASS